MKICILSQNLFTLGGVQKVIATILNEISENLDNQIEVIMPLNKHREKCFDLRESIKLTDIRSIGVLKKRIIYDKVKSLNKRIGFLDNKFFKKNLYRNYFPQEYLNKFTQYFNDGDYDIVISVGDTYTLLLSLIADKIQAKTLGWMHSNFEGYFEKRGHASYGLKQLFKNCMENMDGVCVLTYKDKWRFEKEFGVHCKVLYNPVSINEPLSEEVKRDNILLFVGRLNKRVKGLDYLFNIIKKVNIEKPNYKFVIVGEGQGKKYLLRKIKNNHLEEKIELVGFKKDVSPYYKKSKLLLSTSRWEGFGMSIVEAMTFGVPCIAFENDGPNEIIESGKNGVLISKFDVKKFAEMTIECIDNENKYKLLSEKAYEASKKFSSEKIILEFKTILMNIIEG